MGNTSPSTSYRQLSDAAGPRPFEAAATGLLALDARVRSASRGVVFVQVVDASQAEAVRHHVVRRGARVPGRRALTASVPLLDGCFRDLASRMGVPQLDGDPRVAARQIAETSSGTLSVVEGDFEEGSWDAQVLVHIGRAGA
jgi:hypothetical protein